MARCTARHALESDLQNVTRSLSPLVRSHLLRRASRGTWLPEFGHILRRRRVSCRAPSMGAPTGNLDCVWPREEEQTL